MEQQKKMNLMQLTFIVAVNMMGSGIIMLPTNMAKVGAISLLSWIVTALGSMAIAYGFAQAGLFNQRPGGMSAYAEDAYGKSGYFLVFFLYFLSLAIGNVAIAISAVGYLASFFPWLSSTPIATCIGVIALLWLTTVANFGGPSWTGRIGSITVWGVIIPVGLALAHRLVLVQTADIRGSLESARAKLAGRHGFEHRAHLVGLSGHGIRGAKLSRGGESEARCAAGMLVRHAGCCRHLHPLHDGDPRHRAECGAGSIHRSVRSRLRKNVQSDGWLHHHGAGRHGLPRLATGLAVHDRTDREIGGGRAHVPRLLLQGKQSWAHRSSA